MKTKAWEEVHKKFNELNCRARDPNQLKIQWKGMKIHARKTLSLFKTESNKTGGGTQPVTPEDELIEIKDMLNPAELLKDSNPYDSDSLMPCSSDKTNSDMKILDHTTEQTQAVEDAIASTAFVDKITVSERNPRHKRDNVSKSRKNHEYVNIMLAHSKSLKDEEHKRRMEMAEEEHAIKLAIYKEKFVLYWKNKY